MTAKARQLKDGTIRPKGPSAPPVPTIPTARKEQLISMLTAIVPTLSDEELDKLSFEVYVEQMERKNELGDV